MAKEKESKEFLTIPSRYGINRLYRYRSMESKELQGIFENREIYLPNPTSFNDPFECRPNIIIHRGKVSRELYIKGIRKKLRPYLNKKQKELYIREAKMILSDQERLNKLFESFMKGIGIYCLSTTKDDILMWSYYSDSHKGLCLEFDTTKDITYFGQAFKVNYGNEYPSIDVIKIGLGKDYEYRKAVLVKSTHWEYEQEWRILKPESYGGPGIHTFQPELLTGVILGALICPEDKQKVLDWVQDYPTKITLYQAKINRTKYQLNIEPI